jgi:structural maintenance of chromosome 1
MLYLREHRIGVASFIPLNGIKIKEINERLRVGLGPNTKLCIDLIQCASDIRPAVQYAVENTVVCETLSDARDLCFRRGENVKAVTLDGSVISKAGTMTGGNSARDASGSSRWDGQVHADLKKRRDKLIQEVNKLETAHRDNELVSELKTKITQLKSKEQYAVKDLQITNEKMVAIQKQAQELKKQIAHVNQEKQKVLPMISDRENSIRAIQSRVAAHEDEIYNAFSRSIGVMNIREFEEGHLRVLQETSENRRKVREQKAKLEAQLQFEKTKDFGTPLEKISKRLVQTKARLAQCDEAAKSLSQEEKSRRTRLRSAEGDRDEAKQSLEEKEIEVKTLQNERGECAKERNALAKKITAEE